MVLNREDPRIRSLAQIRRSRSVNVSYFGLDETLRSFFPSDDEMRAGISQRTAVELPSADVTLTAFSGTSATFDLAGGTCE